MTRSLYDENNKINRHLCHKRTELKTKLLKVTLRILHRFLWNNASVKQTFIEAFTINRVVENFKKINWMAQAKHLKDIKVLSIGAKPTTTMDILTCVDDINVHCIQLELKGTPNEEDADHLTLYGPALAVFVRVTSSYISQLMLQLTVIRDQS